MIVLLRLLPVEHHVTALTSPLTAPHHLRTSPAHSVTRRGGTAHKMSYKATLTQLLLQQIAVVQVTTVHLLLHLTHKLSFIKVGVYGHKSAYLGFGSSCSFRPPRGVLGRIPTDKGDRHV